MRLDKKYDCLAIQQLNNDISCKWRTYNAKVLCLCDDSGHAVIAHLWLQGTWEPGGLRQGLQMRGKPENEWLSTFSTHKKVSS